MEIFPKEIVLIVASYLDSVQNLNNLIDAYELILDNKDYIQLFNLRYPQHFYPNINRFTVKEIYEGFLKIESLLGTKYMAINEVIIILSGEGTQFSTRTKSKKSLGGPIVKKTTIKYQPLIKYLIMNDLIEGNSEVISYLDDLEIFLHAYQIDPKSVYFNLFLDNNSHNILKYIFDNNLWDTEDVEESLFGTEVEIDLKTLKMTLEYLKLDTKFLLELLVVKYYDVNESFNYIFNELLTNKITGEIFYETLEICAERYRSYKTFKLIWNKWSNLLTDDQIIYFYRDIIRNEEVDIGIITLVANHPFIRARYLD